MKQKVCGVCMFQGDSKVVNNGTEIYCLYNYEWNKSDHTCNHWIEYGYHLPINERLLIANAKKETEIRIQQHKEIIGQQNEYNKKQLRWSRWLVFATWALVIATLLLIKGNN